MPHKHARPVFLQRFCIGFCLLLLTLCPSGRAAAESPRHGLGLFSWQTSVMQPEERERLFAVMEELSLTELTPKATYQPSDEINQAIKGATLAWATAKDEKEGAETPASEGEGEGEGTNTNTGGGNNNTPSGDLEG